MDRQYYTIHNTVQLGYHRRSGNFRIENNSRENFRVLKFSFNPQIFLTVDSCNIDERLESSWCLVYYQVSGKQGIACCSRRLDIYPGECGLARASFHRRIIYISRVKIFEVGHECEIILTAKFSRSTIYS